MQKSIEKIIVDIIKHELNLPDNYGKTSKGDIIPSVIIYGQNIKLFNTDKMQITVRTVISRDYSNRSESKENPNPVDPEGKDAFLEVQDINQFRMIQIDVRSRNNEARERYWEIGAALNSIYCEQQQDLYNFKIGTISKANNLTGIEGGSDINRFTISVNILVHYEKSKPINYFNQFPLTAEAESGEILETNNIIER